MQFCYSLCEWVQIDFNQSHEHKITTLYHWYYPSLQIESFAIKKLRGVPTKLNNLFQTRIKPWTWKDDINEVAKKAAKGIGILCRFKGFLDKDTLKNVYSAFVLPHFDFCALVWHNCSKTLQNKLQKLVE